VSKQQNSKNDARVFVGGYVPAKTAKALSEGAKKEGRPISDMLRRLLAQSLGVK
jgi:hypothetical protein